MSEDLYQREFDFDAAGADATGDVWRPTLAHTHAPSAQPFAVPAGAQELPHAVRAHSAIDRLMEANHPCVVAFSSGKDSSVVANLTLTTAAVRRAQGKPVPPIVVIHSDTGVENPEVRRLADGELRKITRFARQYGIPVQVRIGQPLLYSSWPVRVISGRALPSFADSARDCSVEWKVRVGQRLTAVRFPA
jgi:DNA sulfur modification protein DndC